MFDNQPVSGAAPTPAGQPAEDIFANLENKSMSPQTPVVSPMLSMDDLGAPPHASKSGKFLLIGLLTLIAMLAGGFYVYQFILLPKVTGSNQPIQNLDEVIPEQQASENTLNNEVLPPAEPNTPDNLMMAESTTTVTSSLETDMATTSEIVASGEAEAAASAAPADSDGDGLSDDRELSAGTNALKIDSDGDSLNDQEELEIWKTNPLLKDTDGDSFDDGQEIKAGYNPNGSGKSMIVK